MEKPDQKSEDWCFICKDGGGLLICEYAGCLKSYHSRCVEKKRKKRKALEKSEDPWYCRRHVCSKSDCKDLSKFHCLFCPYAVCGPCSNAAEFAVVKEKKGICRTCCDLAIDGFDNEKYDCVEMDDKDKEEQDKRFFIEYVAITMGGEDLEVEDLYAAEAKIRERINANKANRVRKVKDDVDVVSFDRNENGRGSGLKKKSECVMPRRKKQKTHVDRVFEKNNGDTESKKRDFASIVPENIKLVYLRKSLIEKLIMQPDKFEDKVVGSYVGVKKESGKRFGKPSCQLLQVTGIKKSPDEDFNKGVSLQVSCCEADVDISMLCDNEVSEELCEELKQKMKDGLLKKPIVEELELKARSLHEDIKKDWIERELVRLQNVINFANERGRSGLKYNSLDQLKRLKNQREQERLLQALPTVIPEVMELKSTDADVPPEVMELKSTYAVSVESD